MGVSLTLSGQSVNNIPSCCTRKYTNITKACQNNWDNLAKDLDETNWDNVFNTQNLFSIPNENYTNFINNVIELKNKHMPSKKVRFKRYKHKNNAWITQSLISSIKCKDQLDKKFRCLSKNDPTYEQIKTEFKTSNL